ncbi:type III secretion system export apparatus subunit SctT [Noviherbaspirillum saxi]|nr:type III secretion system export apparatus subunit SctT [Noviherbaspirillum saxi]
MIGVAHIGEIRDGLLAVALALPRMLVCMLLIPVFSSSTLNRTLRIAVAIGFTLPVSFGIAHSSLSVAGPVMIVALILKEAFVGLVLGTALAAPFWAMDSVGAFIDIQRGANTGQQLTPFSQQDASLIGSALQQALIAFLAVTGGLSALYQLLLGSYAAWPVLVLIPDFSGLSIERMIDGFAELCRLSFLYAVPILAVLILVDFCFALVGLFATQLQVYFAAMPVKSIVGIFVLLLYVGILLEHGHQYFSRMIESQSTLFENIVRR